MVPMTTQNPEILEEAIRAWRVVGGEGVLPRAGADQKVGMLVCDPARDRARVPIGDIQPQLFPLDDIGRGAAEIMGRWSEGGLGFALDTRLGAGKAREVAAAINNLILYFAAKKAAHIVMAGNLILEDADPARSSIVAMLWCDRTLFPEKSAVTRFTDSEYIEDPCWFDEHGKLRQSPDLYGAAQRIVSAGGKLAVASDGWSGCIQAGGVDPDAFEVMTSEVDHFLGSVAIVTLPTPADPEYLAVLAGRRGAVGS